MIAVVFPRSLNWFYRAQAQSIADDLVVQGVPACTVASDEVVRLADLDPDAALIVSFAESLLAAERSGTGAVLLDVLKRCRRRILVNFDSIRSRWFTDHFSEGPAFFSEIFDIGLHRQTAEATVARIPYHFVPEAFSSADRRGLMAWAPGRRLPWTMLGHATRDRAALVEAALRCLPGNGFVFMPPLRPFTARSGLDRAAIARVLAETDLYIWGSTHHAPYHETQRALHAVAAGAIPVKIDPFFSHQFDLPWVYPSLEAMLEQRRRIGLDGMSAAARATLDRQGTLGANIARALGDIGLAPAAA